MEGSALGLEQNTLQVLRFCCLGEISKNLDELSNPLFANEFLIDQMLGELEN